jgi:gluconokinase
MCGYSKPGIGERGKEGLKVSTGDYLIAVDIGTTSTKALLYRVGGAIENYASQSYPTYYPQPGFVEQDPEEILSAVIQVISALVEKTEVHPQSILAITFGGVWQSMMAVDSHCQALSRAMIWADIRALKQNERLQAELTTEEIRERTGCTLHPMYFLSRLMWFQEEVPEIFRRSHKFISIKEYILYHLFGQFVVDRSIASGTGILRMSTMDWDEELLEKVGVGSEKFSLVLEPTTILKGLKPAIASQTGLLAGTPGVVGAADGALSHLGSVGLADDKMSMMVSTGAALRKRLTRPQILPGTEAWCYYLMENNWLMGGIVQDAGNVMKWFTDHFVAEDGTEDRVFALINEYAKEVEPGADGVVFLPFLGGERCPFYRPEARGTVHGLRFSHTKKHLIRALMEGISYRLYSVYKMLAGDSEPELVVAGGLLKSPVWMQITADFFGKRLWKPKIEEAAAWGGILLGLRALGIIDEIGKITEWVEVEGKQEPNPEVHRKYQSIYDSYDKLYAKLYKT